MVRDLGPDHSQSLQNPAKLLLLAAAYRNLKVFQKIITKYPISQEERGKIAIQLTTTTQREREEQTDPSPRFLSLLLRQGPLLQKDLEYSVFLAAFKNRLSNMEQLLRSGTISPDSRGWAAITAARAGQWEALHRLILNGEIPSAFRAKIAKLLILKGKGEASAKRCLKALLFYGPLPQKSREQAICLAVLHQRLSELDILLKEGPISSNARGHAALFALKRKDFPTLKKLIEGGEISEEKRDELALLLVQQPPEAESLIRPLLKYGSLSKKARSEAALHSFENQRFQDLYALLDAGPIDTEIGDHLLEHSFRQNHQLLFVDILKKKVSSEKERDQLALFLTHPDQKNIPYARWLEVLLQLGTISDSARGVAFRNLALSNRAEDCQLLLKAGTIPQKELDIVFKYKPLLRGKLSSKNSNNGNGTSL